LCVYYCFNQNNEILMNQAHLLTINVRDIPFRFYWKNYNRSLNAQWAVVVSNAPIRNHLLQSMKIDESSSSIPLFTFFSWKEKEERWTDAKVDAKPKRKSLNHSIITYSSNSTSKRRVQFCSAHALAVKPRIWQTVI